MTIALWMLATALAADVDVQVDWPGAPPVQAVLRDTGPGTFPAVVWKADDGSDLRLTVKLEQEGTENHYIHVLLESVSTSPRGRTRTTVLSKPTFLARTHQWAELRYRPARQEDAFSIRVQVRDEG